MITDTCQRWTEQRESRRPAGELIRTSEFEVESIACAEVARAFIKRHHYSGSPGPLAHRFGLYQRGELAGVAAFGPPPSMNAHRKVFPSVATDAAVTLARFVLVDSVPGNAESWFIARCFDLLRERGVVAVESCADPTPRHGTDGRLVHRGHVGTIYQATNGVYVGKTNPASLRLFPDGTVLSNRTSGKAARGERGEGQAVSQLVAWGATPPVDGEDTLAWIRRWRPQLTRPMRHQGNHRYLWCLDRRRRREVLRFDALPYPKVAS